MIKTEYTYSKNKFSIAALLIYIFLLASISFHHHPFEFSIFNFPNLESGTVEDSVEDANELTCPIVHFAKNSFQSLAESNTTVLDLTIVDITSIEPSDLYFSSLKLHQNLRAPPLNT